MRCMPLLLLLKLKEPPDCCTPTLERTAAAMAEPSWKLKELLMMGFRRGM